MVGSVPPISFISVINLSFLNSRKGTLLMFAKSELSQIDSDYFNIIHAGCHAVTVQSLCTGHYWHIIHQVGHHFSSCQVSHKHHPESEWHLQCNRHTLRLALDEIKQHDEFHLRRKQLKQSGKFHSDRT